MNVIPFTLRIPSEMHGVLEAISKIEGRPMNQLANEALKSYLSRRGEKERSLEETLALLREYRKKDADFRESIANFVESEAAFEDTVEGVVVEGQLIDGKLREIGTTQSKLRELLNA